MIILGTNSIKDTGSYQVDNSLRFERASNDALNITPSSASNRKTFTVSAWIKKGDLTSDTTTTIIGARVNGSNNFDLSFEDDFELRCKIEISDNNYFLRSSALYRDTSAWYHVVLAVDTTQATDTNRVKLYVNGVILSSFATSTFPDRNADTSFNNTNVHQIGGTGGGGQTSMYLSEMVVIDGQALDPTSFGEFDEDSGIWKPIKVSGLTFGTNGFYLEFKQAGTGTNASGMGADTSGNTNHLAVANLTAVDQSTDTCTNNMPTFNSNDNQRQGFTFTEGNLKITATPAYDYVVATMGVSSGKWYWETKIITIPSGDYIYNGISDHNQYQANFDMGGEAGQYCLSRVAGKIKAASGSETTYGGSMSAGNIQGFALDVDNLKLYISNNGQWSNGSGAWDSTTFNAGTGVINIAYSTLAGGGTHWFPAIGNGDGNIGMEINFGSPVSAISSGNADGDGFGNFEYAVPSGYFALNTKNLAEYG